MSIKVFGHQSPDTDATGSAIIWSWYLNTKGKEATPYVLGDLNTETKFVLEYWKLPTPELLENISANDKVAIVDTNNPKELFESINEATILQVIDHHKLVGGLETKAPLEMILKPLASCASVIYTQLSKEAFDQMPKALKGLLLSCILSDTLGFRSPTTTDFDKKIAHQIAKEVGLENDLEAYAQKMFEAKSDIAAFSDQELLKMDSKKYEVNGKKYRISVLETTAPNVVLERKQSIFNSIEVLKTEEQDTDEVLLFVIDILKEEATFFLPNDAVKDLAKKSFNADTEKDTTILPGVVSRKKQIIPAL